jgi:CheY-like chemotaxis protein
MLGKNEIADARGHGPILIVDDNPDFRDAMVEVLTDAGRQVVLAQDGEDAMMKLAKLTRTGRPCLILLDLKMPVMDGLEFLDELASLHWNVPVLVVSATGIVARGQRYPHVLGTLEKPFHIPELLSLVDEYC